MFDGVQLIVARIAERTLSGWWSDSHISGNLYLQRGAQTKTVSIDDKEDQLNGTAFLGEGSLLDMLPVERNIYMIFWK